VSEPRCILLAAGGAGGRLFPAAAQAAAERARREAVERVVSEPRCILLAAGGTGGHLFPAAALAAALGRRGAAVELATDDRGFKYSGDFPARAIHALPSATTTGAGALSKARAALVLGAGLASALLLLGRLKPRAVVGFGGYPTVAPLTAAWLIGAPSALHEQNAVIGRANRFLASRVSLIATGFPELQGVDAALAAKARYTGNPVRANVIAAAATPYPDFAEGRLRVLITGGSQGARVMADVAPAALARLTRQERARIRLAMQARGEDKARVAAACAELSFPVELAEFFADLPQRIAASHLVVARAGASTVSELAVIGRPSILVPFPHALDQDQAANAAALAASGAATVIPQNEFTPERLAELLRGALADPTSLQAAAKAAKAAGVPDAAERLADLVMGIAAPES
jgi:UDP-N-acetylglucosamine--N-acetylmuramyl-(pentapeptide) pyrophosphoryl-undecaprenol N-acetylglucosamine transferase